MLGDRFLGVVDIRGVYDFKSHLDHVRPASADKDIKLQFSTELHARGGKIMVRTKSSVSARVPWSKRYQMMPYRGHEQHIPAPEEEPLTMPSKEYKVCTHTHTHIHITHHTHHTHTHTPKEWDSIRYKLLKFYNYKFEHHVVVPDKDREEMLHFLNVGPSLCRAPAWIQWDKIAPTSGAPDHESPKRPTQKPVRKRKSVWRPFLAPRAKKGKRSRTKTARNSRADDDNAPPRADDDNAPSPAVVAESQTGVRSSDDSENLPVSAMLSRARAVFPFPIGTFVAVEFDAGIFRGNITKHFPGEDSCLVTFDDGDAGEYDAGQITYAVALYKREFPEYE